MKQIYTEPKADIRFLLSQDIIAASGEPTQNLNPEGVPGVDAKPDPFT